MRFTIEGPPRTKKNSMRIVKSGTRSRLIQSRAAMKWEDDALLQLRSQLHRAPSDLPVVVLPYYCGPVSMAATVYRDRAVGDLLNFLSAISDALERAGVVSDDKLIVSVDGSRLALDRKRPRVEIELLPAT